MKFALDINGVLHRVDAELLDDGRLRLVHEGGEHEAEILSSHQHLYSVLFQDGQHHEILAAREKDGSITFYIHTHVFNCRMYDMLELETMQKRRAEEVGQAWRLTAQMPGKVVRLLACVGQEVQKGDALLVVEAMKMQNEITAARPGKITKVQVEPGTIVENGTPLMEADPL